MHFIKALIAPIEYKNDGSRAMPLYKKEKLQNKMEKEELESALVLGASNLHGFLGRFARRYFGLCGLVSNLDKGALGVHKELRRQWAGGIRHTFWDPWMVSTNVVFEHTTPVLIGKDHLKSLLVLFLHGLLVPTRLRMKGGHLIFGCSKL